MQNEAPNQTPWVPEPLRPDKFVRGGINRDPMTPRPDSARSAQAAEERRGERAGEVTASARPKTRPPAAPRPGAAFFFPSRTPCSPPT